MTAFDRLFAAADAKMAQIRKTRLIERFGGIQTCPWCKQIAQIGENWSFKASADGEHDVLTCGICGGTSLWRFEHGMHYVGIVRPPPPLSPTTTGLSYGNFGGNRPTSG